MLERRRNMNLRQKTLGTEYRGELRQKHLHGDLPPMPQILGQVDGRHAAFADFPLDAVSVRERRDETVG
jgi:hypothetical protein